MPAYGSISELAAANYHPHPKAAILNALQLAYANYRKRNIYDD